MLIEQIDRIGLQPLERRIGNGPDALRTAVQALMRISIFKAELGCDQGLPPERRKRLAHQFLIRERTVGLGGVKERYAALECRSDQ